MGNKLEVPLCFCLFCLCREECVDLHSPCDCTVVQAMGSGFAKERGPEMWSSTLWYGHDRAFTEYSALKTKCSIGVHNHRVLES